MNQAYFKIIDQTVINEMMLFSGRDISGEQY